MNDSRPNILILIPHDLGDMLGCYGRSTVASPNLDALASRGVRLSQCFCAGPACSPSRASLFTGLHPHANGMCGLANFGWRLTQPHLAERLAAIGYETHQFGFQHEAHGPVENLGYRHVHRPSDVTGRAANDARIVCRELAGFLEREPVSDRPWFACAGFFHVHRPWPETTRFAPSDLEVPPYLPDLPAVREDLAQFHESIAEMDAAVGTALDSLAGSAHAERTLVVFTTDHGPGLPRAKATLYDPGLRVAMLLHQPGRIEGGRVMHGLVSNADFAPTILWLLGEDVPEEMHGRSFAASLTGADAEGRDATFSSLLYDVAYDPMHCVRTPTHKYIRSFAVTDADAAGADRDVLASHAAGQWVRVDDFDVLSSPTWRAIASPQPKPRREELYDIEADPHEQANLASDPDASDVLTSMRKRLDDWMDRTDSPLRHGHVTPPPEQKQASERYRHGGPMYG